MSMAHHGEEPELLMRKFLEQRAGKLKREYPEGRIDGTDDGQLLFAIAADPLKNVVRVEFGKAVAWLAMSAADARALAAKLIEKAEQVEATANAPTAC